jgi:DNA-binding CsgD family transcriptional regulator
MRKIAASPLASEAMAGEIYGREEELSRVEAFIGRAGRPAAAMVLEGDAGIGKSTLWLAGLDLARKRGFRLLLSRPAEAERDLAYLGLGDLFDDALDLVLPALSAPRRAALEVATLRDHSGPGAVDARALGVALRDALRLLSADQTVLIAIDDVQWFDDPSARALAFALRRLPKVNVAVLLARRGAVTTLIEEAVDAEHITIGPLSVGAAHKLIQTRLQLTLSRPALLSLHERSGGNPFYILELARLADGGAATLDRLVGGRLKDLPPATRRALLLVAAHGRPPRRLIDNRELAPALDANVLEVDAETVRFTHPLLAAAVYEGATQEDRRRVHRLLASTADDDISRARHLALGAAGSDEAVADELERAAAAASARGATMFAAQLAELSVALTPADAGPEFRRRVIQQADLLSATGDGRRAISLLEAACNSAPAGLARAKLLAREADVEDRFIGPRRAIALYREALAEADGDDALVAAVHKGLAGLVMVSEERNEGLEHARRAVEAASRTGDAALRCEALAAYGQIHFRSGLGVAKAEMDEAVALERSLPSWPVPASASWSSVYQLLWAGELDRARTLIEDMRPTLVAREDPELEQLFWFGALVEWRAGHWPEAARQAAACLAIREEFGIEGQQPPAELPAALIDAHMGRIDEARQRSERMLRRAESEGILIAQSGHRWVLGFIELSLGDATRALDYLRRGWELRDSVNLLEPGHRFELADTLEALIAAGELDEAEAKLAPWEDRSRRLDRSWALAITSRCRALLHSARGDLAAAQRQFDDALGEHARTQDPFQHARTLLAMGSTQRRAKHRSAARSSLEQALAIFNRLPAPLWADKARAELGRIGGRAPAKDDELTEAERRVAELVAMGRTNHEVAASLFLGERTVASHLTHIYAKLGVRSRTELAHRLR